MAFCSFTLLQKKNNFFYQLYSNIPSTCMMDYVVCFKLPIILLFVNKVVIYLCHMISVNPYCRGFLGLSVFILFYKLKTA